MLGKYVLICRNSKYLYFFKEETYSEIVANIIKFKFNSNDCINKKLKDNNFFYEINMV